MVDVMWLLRTGMVGGSDGAERDRGGVRIRHPLFLMRGLDRQTHESACIINIHSRMLCESFPEDEVAS